jgi:hypothetical protein
MDDKCTQCGGSKIDQTKKMCESCRKKRRERAARLEKERKEKGECAKCGCWNDRKGAYCTYCLRNKKAKKNPQILFECLNCGSNLLPSEECQLVDITPEEIEEFGNNVFKSADVPSAKQIVGFLQHSDAKRRAPRNPYCLTCQQSEKYAKHIIEKCIAERSEGECHCCGEKHIEVLTYVSNEIKDWPEMFEDDPDTYGPLSDFISNDMVFGLKNNARLVITCFNCLIAAIRYGRCPHQQNVFEGRPVSIKQVINFINQQAISNDLQLEALQKAIEELKEENHV